MAANPHGDSSPHGCYDAVPSEEKTMKAPSSETAWAKAQEQEQIARFRAEREARIREHERLETEAKRRQLKEQHWLCCPKCGHQMEERDLVSIKVDVCTFCEGTSVIA